MEFDSFSEKIREGIAGLGWKEPVAVQQRVIPLMRAGRDLIVQAITGSGKTGAFGLPIVESIDQEKKAIQALALAPTRELAAQVANEISAMGRPSGIEAFAIYGGVAYGPQIEALERGVPIIAGTPGRILDHLKAKRMDLRQVRILIFDEADELLSLGFWPDIRDIQSFLPKKRQSGLFSATIPERVRSLARIFLNDPEFVSMREGGVRSPEEIEHYYFIVSAQEKENVLVRILEHEDPDSAILFCNTRDDVRYLAAFLRRQGYDADMIQGEMSQAAREEVMGRIKAGKLRFLVATDVAARGIDISDLSHVFSYTTPDQPEIYLHRTGRTGRAGKTGTAISLVSGLDIGSFKNLQLVNRMTIPERPVPNAKQAVDLIARRVVVRMEHDLRELPERERDLRKDRYLPVIEEMQSTEEGRRALAALVFSYLGSPVPVESATRREEPRPRDEESGDRQRRKRKRRKTTDRSRR
jgi:ATP-dependent RNA helicase DeaD